LRLLISEFRVFANHARDCIGVGPIPKEFEDHCSNRWWHRRRPMAAGGCQLAGVGSTLAGALDDRRQLSVEAKIRSHYAMVRRTETLCVTHYLTHYLDGLDNLAQRHRRWNEHTCMY
jgi:hypothetical protein